MSAGRHVLSEFTDDALREELKIRELQRDTPELLRRLHEALAWICTRQLRDMGLGDFFQDPELGRAIVLDGSFEVKANATHEGWQVEIPVIAAGESARLVFTATIERRT